VLRGAVSWPHILARACTGVFCFNRGIKLAAEAEAQSKKQYVLRFSWISLAWLLLMPLAMLFSSEDSWRRDAVLLDSATFCMLGALLHDFWPSRFGALFSCLKPTERTHPYLEFGLDG